jgi:hypothetical protein
MPPRDQEIVGSFLEDTRCRANTLARISFTPCTATYAPEVSLEYDEDVGPVYSPEESLNTTRRGACGVSEAGERVVGSVAMYAIVVPVGSHPKARISPPIESQTIAGRAAESGWRGE